MTRSLNNAFHCTCGCRPHPAATPTSCCPSTPSHAALTCSLPCRSHAAAHTPLTRTSPARTPADSPAVNTPLLEGRRPTCHGTCHDTCHGMLRVLRRLLDLRLMVTSVTVPHPHYVVSSRPLMLLQPPAAHTTQQPQPGRGPCGTQSSGPAGSSKHTW